MPPLKASYDTQEAVPEALRPYYEEKDGKWVAPQIEGAPSATDLEKVNTALSAERAAHQETANKLKPFETLAKTPEELKLQETELAEAQAKLSAGDPEKWDQKKYDDLVAKRVAIETEPLNRQIEQLTTERDAATTKVTESEREILQRDLGSDLTAAAIKAEMDSDAVPFWVTQNLGRFEKSAADGLFYTVKKPGDPMLPGLTPAQLVEEAKQTQGFLWPRTEGADIKPGGTGGGIADNPWRSGEHWNKGAQSRYELQHGKDAALVAAKAAGVENPYSPYHPKDAAARQVQPNAAG